MVEDIVFNLHIVSHPRSPCVLNVQDINWTGSFHQYADFTNSINYNSYSQFTNDVTSANCFHANFPPKKPLWQFLFPLGGKTSTKYCSDISHAVHTITSTWKICDQEAEIQWLGWINRGKQCTVNPLYGLDFFFYMIYFCCKGVDDKLRWELPWALWKTLAGLVREGGGIEWERQGVILRVLSLPLSSAAE